MSVSIRRCSEHNGCGVEGVREREGREKEGEGVRAEGEDREEGKGGRERREAERKGTSNRVCIVNLLVRDYTHRQTEGRLIVCVYSRCIKYTPLSSLVIANKSCLINNWWSTLILYSFVAINHKCTGHPTHLYTEGYYAYKQCYYPTHLIGGSLNKQLPE